MLIVKTHSEWSMRYNLLQNPQKSEVDFVSGALPIIWKNITKSSQVPIFHHKLGGKHKKDIIAGLATNGISTTYGLAKFILEKELPLLKK